jgi:hypothetical protein
MGVAFSLSHLVERIEQRLVCSNIEDPIEPSFDLLRRAAGTQL